MDDKKLLELAAKAAGVYIDKSSTNGGGIGNTGFDVFGNIVIDWHNGVKWNPLTNNSDALWLAVKLGIHITNSSTDAWASTPRVNVIEAFNGDPFAATRRAITTAAARSYAGNSL